MRTYSQKAFENVLTHFRIASVFACKKSHSCAKHEKMNAQTGGFKYSSRISIEKLTNLLKPGKKISPKFIIKLWQVSWYNDTCFLFSYMQKTENA